MIASYDGFVERREVTGNKEGGEDSEICADIVGYMEANGVDYTSFE